jgi:hypothetical protein
MNALNLVNSLKSQSNVHNSYRSPNSQLLCGQSSFAFLSRRNLTS